MQAKFDTSPHSRRESRILEPYVIVLCGRGQMTSVAAKFPQRMAEDEICCACDGLSVPEALGALLEIVAQILADQDIAPETEDFERFMATVATSLSSRVAQLRWEAIATAS